ncbi:hypothetical protein JMJ55_27055 [Belnapia sp. T6]|uniref:Uncharacterized protein n=1 Tax=Belnapia mucosa TaxID=2804532 RepID=A0ABS1VBD5_9PROT|nr:hypothetical protein [Belnapia mucosa]MBL6458994.1 hypothetical protein [Belnapia mucosa]
MVVENMISQDKTYPDKVSFHADRDRLTGICLQFKVAGQAPRIEMETAARRSGETGFISSDDYELGQLALLSSLGKASGPSD